MLLERLCFADAQAAQAAQPIVDAVLVKGQDAILPEGNCLTVRVDERRSELFSRWVAQRLPHARRDFSTMDAPVPTCHLRVSKRQQLRQQGGEVVVRQTGASAIQTSTQGHADEVSTLKMSSGKSATLLVDRQELNVLCHLRPNGGAKLVFGLRPIPPPPHIHGQPPPPIETRPGLQTELDVMPGQEVSLGGVLRDLGGSGHDVSLPQGGSWQQREGSDQTQWFLRLESM